MSGIVLEAMAIRVERARVRPQRLPAIAHQLRRQMIEQSHFRQLAKRALRRARAEDLVELLEQPRRRRFADQVRVPADRVDDQRIDAEVEARGQHDRAQHAHRIFAEAHVGIADRADDPRLQILDAARVVDDRERRDVVEERVDREVAAERVLFRRAERVVAAAGAVVAIAAAGLGSLRPPGRPRRPRPPARPFPLRSAAGGMSRPRWSSCRTSRAPAGSGGR